MPDHMMGAPADRGRLNRRCTGLVTVRWKLIGQLAPIAGSSWPKRAGGPNPLELDTKPVFDDILFVRVVLADDQAVVLQAIREFLAEKADIRVLAAATSGAEAVVLTLEPRLDVASPSIKLSPQSGFQLPDILRLIWYVFPILTESISGFSLQNL